jgi:hypothetical protein
LQDLAYGGHLVTRRPSPEQPHGYVVERLDWYRCVVPDGVAPSNQDGEVAQFALLAPGEVARRMQCDEFTVDAALMLQAAGL